MATHVKLAALAPSPQSGFPGGHVPIRPHPIALARRFFQICTGILSEELSELGLKPLQAAILAYLHDEPDIDQNGLAARIGIDRASTSQLIDQLEEAGLVERRVNGDDRRARLLRLTRRGIKMRERARPAGHAATEHILASLSPSERNNFTNQLIRIIAENESYARPGAGRRKPGSLQSRSTKK
jgi:DNA-binding MarR family transcriptional regulator